MLETFNVGDVKIIHERGVALLANQCLGRIPQERWDVVCDGGNLDGSVSAIQVPLSEKHQSPELE
jgi:hypothetical protein